MWRHCGSLVDPLLIHSLLSLRCLLPAPLAFLRLARLSPLTFPTLSFDQPTIHTLISSYILYIFCSVVRIGSVCFVVQTLYYFNKHLPLQIRCLYAYSQVARVTSNVQACMCTHAEQITRRAVKTALYMYVHTLTPNVLSRYMYKINVLWSYISILVGLFIN